LIGQEKTAGTIDFYLLSGWSSVPDVRTIHSGSADEWKKFNEDLNLEHPLFEKRMGINLIDTSVNQGPVIARVSLKTTDEAQPLTAGDILVAVNNNPVQNAAQAMATAENLQQAPQITLSVMRSGSKIDVPVKMINGPVEISFEDSRLLYNRQLATFKKVFSLSINPLEKNIALLNTGLCFMHSGEYEDALDQFRQIENLNRPVGIGQGTVKFHMAACLEAEGNRTEADSNLTEASHYPQNTLRSDDGLPLTIEVEQTRKSVH
jgi:tetratricopeptide (TPR) repeat protein